MQLTSSTSYNVVGALAIGLATSASAIAIPVSGSLGDVVVASTRSGPDSCQEDGSQSNLCNLASSHNSRDTHEDASGQGLKLRSATQHEMVVDPKLIVTRQLPQGSLPAAIPANQVQQIPGQVIEGVSQGGVAYFPAAAGGIVEEIIPAGLPVQPQALVPGPASGAFQSDGEASSDANAVPAPFSQVVGVPGQVAQTASGVLSGAPFPGPASGVTSQVGGVVGQMGAVPVQGAVYGIPGIGGTAGGLIQGAGLNPIGAAGNAIYGTPNVGGTAGGVVQGIGSNPFGTAGGIVNGAPVIGGMAGGVVQGLPNPLPNVQGVAGSLPLSTVAGVAGGTPLGGIVGSLPLEAAGNMFQGEPEDQVEHEVDTAHIPWSPSSTMATPSNTPHLDPNSPKVANVAPPLFSAVTSSAPINPSSLPMQPSNVTTKLPPAPVPPPSLPVSPPNAPVAPPGLPVQPSAPNGLPTPPNALNAPTGLPSPPNLPVQPPGAPVPTPPLPVQPPSGAPSVPSLPVQPPGAPTSVLSKVPHPSAPNAPTPPVAAPSLPTPSTPAKPFQKLARWVKLAQRDVDPKSPEAGQKASNALPSGFPAPSSPIPNDHPPLLGPAIRRKDIAPAASSRFPASITASASTFNTQPSRRSLFKMFKRQE